MKFVQFLRPYGRRRTIEVIRPETIEAMASELVAAGKRLETEVLTTGQVSFTVEDDTVEENGPLAHEITANSVETLDAVDRLITSAHAAMKQRNITI